MSDYGVVIISGLFYFMLGTQSNKLIAVLHESRDALQKDSRAEKEDNPS